MAAKFGKGTKLEILSGRQAKLNRIIFLLLDPDRLLTSYDLYLEIRRIKGYRGTKRQSVDRRIKALYQEGWLQKEGTRPAKAHFLSPLYRLSIRARVATVLNKSDLNRYLCTAPETQLKALLDLLNSTKKDTSL